MNVTVPAGVPESPATDAVNVTACPTVEGFGADTTVVDETRFGTCAIATPAGPSSTGIGSPTTVLVAVPITDTLSEAKLAT
nr:hypothetical protein [Streptomyces sp. NRRL F-2664]